MRKIQIFIKKLFQREEKYSLKDLKFRALMLTGYKNRHVGTYDDVRSAIVWFLDKVKKDEGN